jgi:hypothetical protein
MPDKAKPEQVLDEVFAAIEEGAQECGCGISQEAEDWYRRRYYLSVKQKLDNNNTNDWEQLHSANVIRVGRAHGKVAGVICKFHFEAGTPGSTNKVDSATLAKAGNLMETECHSYLRLKVLAKSTPGDQGAKVEANLEMLGAYCW